ncbi:bifunctional glycosyltransferase family 2 protein/CDP-glycerol:glycerophosphate glycerophosphotransferase [Mammaliicoccus sciuri]|uniref:bifunctional glycosyltransferase family 2 protein/CDP-glycerol:glycerophosphate glycerophosphotransferase n=1 Tax=Mammaliicoccus sciuri TaxID=1296 RepID=UPI001FB1D53E|nr:bifunctional glycosyltransferase family 2 protein/CDP-glycerol:glycerophosphate glycerophosphotransferase [Mammaliicoccus sciuri]MCJ1782816.1 bifunctional glycosyltransferase family 2 protein/CDP-glycerol:glycerophosphate glycerophosphotransferase [Mammaliicoccus sciuri]
MYFSLVVVYSDNNKKFISNCIKSLENQTYSDFEVLFLHNGSEFLNESLKNTNLNHQNIESDLSIQGLRNLGITSAKGEYVLFVDSDDFLHPNALIYAKQIIDKDKENINVIKLGITKTNLDMKTSLSNRNQAFYKDDTVESIQSILEGLNIETDRKQQNGIINGLFENNVISHKSIKHNYKKYINKISYSFKVHGLLINKEFLINNNIRFEDNNDLYGEIPFIVNLYNQTPSIYVTYTKLYYKFIHNDPINYPSLAQEDIDSRLYYRMKAFKDSLKYCENPFIARQIRSKAISYYLYKVIKNHKFKEDYNSILPIYKELQQILKYPCGKLKISKRHEFEIKSIKSGNFKLAYYISKTRATGYKTYQFIQPVNQRFRQKKVQKHVFSKLPIKENTVLYESFLGRNYSDSPKAIFNYLLENEPKKWNHVWILNDKKIVENEPEFKNSNVKIIRRFSWEYFMYVTISKYFVLNMRQPKWLYKKPEQVLLSTWHGTPLKKLVFDMDNVTSANKNYKKDFYEQSRNWDYLIAANKYSEDIFNSAFMYPREDILTYGYPRNDILTNHTEEYKNGLKKKLGIPVHKKVILYAPTWRDDQFHGPGQYKFLMQLDLQRLREELGDEYVVALRMHYFISDNLDLSEFKNFAFDFSRYNDINDLYISSDILITDYSSVFFDFANLRKPILFYTYDLEKYKDVLRGFYIDMNKDLPGPLLFDSEEVIDSIKNIETVENDYQDKYDEFYNKYCSLDDGKATERVVKEVFK